MTEEMYTALANYDWLMRNSDDVRLDWEAMRIIYESTRLPIDHLFQAGLTPATAPTQD